LIVELGAQIVDGDCGYAIMHLPSFGRVVGSLKSNLQTLATLLVLLIYASHRRGEAPWWPVLAT